VCRLLSAKSTLDNVGYLNRICPPGSAINTTPHLIFRTLFFSLTMPPKVLKQARKCCHSGYLSWNRPDSSWPNLRPRSTTFTFTRYTSCTYVYLMYIYLLVYSVGQSTQFSYAVVDVLSTTDSKRAAAAIAAALSTPKRSRGTANQPIELSGD
jgi:hypothetical protein